MITKKLQITLFLLTSVAIILTGCIVSGTFVLDIKFTDEDFTQNGNSYHTLVDLTEEDVWQEHSDKLDDVDMVGFELWVTNTGTSSTFNMYVDDASNPVLLTPTSIDLNTTKVLNNLTVPVGTRHVTYGQSFSYLVNVGTLTKLAKTGEFHFYATWTAATSMVIDSARVVVTISASDT